MGRNRQVTENAEARGGQIILSEEDDCLRPLMQKTTGKHQYPRVSLPALIVFRATGKLLDKDEIIAFKDGNTENCRRENLKISNQAGVNYIRKPWKHSSKYKGVSLRTDKTGWSATLSVNGERRHLGTFDCEREAALEYNKAVIESNLENAYLNDVS